MRTAFATGMVIFALAGGAQAASASAWDCAIAEASGTFAIPAPWIRAVIRVESAGDPKATSHSGAAGLMQIMPDTWTVLRQRLHLGTDPYDPHDNVMAGTALLRELYDRFGPSGFLAAYNASPQRYLAYLTAGQPLSDETRAYLRRIAPLLGDARLAQAVIAPGARPDWHSAPLFVAALEHTPAGLWAATRPVHSTAAGTQPAGSSGASEAPAPSRLEPQSAGLFASLAAGAVP